MLSRIRKILCSRYFWMGIYCVAIFSLLMTRYVYYYTNFVPGRYISDLCLIGLVLFVINRDESPEFKMLWLVILLALRLPAVIIFLFFTSVRQTRNSIRRYEQASVEINEYISKQEVKTAPVPNNAAACLQLHYLTDASAIPFAQCGGVVYYPLGEAFLAALLNSLTQAEHFIFIEYFIIQEGTMWNAIHEILLQKATEGIMVCLMYDDFGCMTTLPGNYSKVLEDEGIHCVNSNRLSLVLSRLVNNRDHRKITVIDGKVGFTGGINLADEYINAVEKYGHWKDTAIKIDGGGVDSLTILFLRMWNSQSKYHLEPAQYLTLTEYVSPHGDENGIVFPYGTGPEPMYQESLGKNVYMNMINGAQQYCYVMTPYLICDYDLLYTLRLAAKKGVDVRLITPHVPDKKVVQMMTRSNYQALIQDGVKIYEYTPGFIHAKSMICDDQFAVCGTINLDYRSLAHHFEDAVWMYRTPCIADMKSDFLQTQELSEPVCEEQVKLPFFEKLTAQFIKIFAPLM